MSRYIIMESSLEILAKLDPSTIKPKRKKKLTEKQIFVKPKGYKNATSSEFKCPKGFKVCRCGKTPKCKKK